MLKMKTFSSPKLARLVLEMVQQYKPLVYLDEVQSHRHLLDFLTNEKWVEGRQMFSQTLEKILGCQVNLYSNAYLLELFYKNVQLFSINTCL